MRLFSLRIGLSLASWMLVVAEVSASEVGNLNLPAQQSTQPTLILQPVPAWEYADCRYSQCDAGGR